MKSALFASMIVVLAGCSADGAGPPDAALDSGARSDAASDSGADASIALDGGGDGGSELDSGALPDAGGGDDAGGGRTCTPTTDCGIGFYCDTPDGACGGTGACAPFDTTATCPGARVPVCGCDGNSYNNECEATRLGQAVDHTGFCDPSAACTVDTDCAGGSFCSFPDGACGGDGTCTSRGIGLFCSMTCTPECGCDGESYVNPCTRRRAGVSLSQGGTCPGGVPPCAIGGACCTTGSDCLVGQECVGPIGGGKCEPIPTAPDCWVDADCGIGSGRVCTGAFVCPCGATCPRPDALGMCE